MFVSTGARTRLRERRREEFANQYVRPLLAEARKLGIDAEELKSMIDLREGTDEPGGDRTGPVQAIRSDDRARQRQLLPGREHHPRPARPQRRGQDHPDADPHRAELRHRRRAVGARPAPVREQRDPDRDLLHQGEPDLPPELPGTARAGRGPAALPALGRGVRRLPDRRLPAAAPATGAQALPGHALRARRHHRTRRPRTAHLLRRAVPRAGRHRPADLLRPTARRLCRVSAHDSALHPPHRRGQQPDRARVADRPGADPAGRERGGAAYRAGDGLRAGGGGGTGGRVRAGTAPRAAGQPRPGHPAGAARPGHPRPDHRPRTGADPGPATGTGGPAHQHVERRRERPYGRQGDIR